MKTIFAIFFCMLAVPVLGYSQASATTEIKNLEEQERTAVIKGDTAALFSLWSADYVVTNPNNMILTVAQIKSYARSGGMAPASFTRNIEKISLGKDIAIVMGAETFIPKDKNGNAGQSIYRRYTNVWIKTAGVWKLSARQATNTLIQ